MLTSHIHCKQKYRPRKSTERGIHAYTVPMKMRIRDIRTSKGMTQGELALAADVPQSTVSRMEAGTINTTLDTLSRVAEALSVDVVDLFEGSSQPTAISALVRQFSRLSIEEQKALLQTADLLLASRQQGA